MYSISLLGNVDIFSKSKYDDSGRTPGAPEEDFVVELGFVYLLSFAGIGGGGGGSWKEVFFETFETSFGKTGFDRRMSSIFSL